MRFPRRGGVTHISPKFDKIIQGIGETSHILKRCAKYKYFMSSTISDTAKHFIIADIQREIDLARITEKTKKSKQKSPLPQGGGNFLAALGLLAYTEFAGKTKFNYKRNGRNHASKNFNGFFDLLGVEYKKLRKQHNVYDILRSGLVHEYFSKKPCQIAMLKPNNYKWPGIVVNDHGVFVFCVEQYFEDFKNALNEQFS
ncbi:hypothetical protein ISS42_01240 [Candidatus Shapirobacteria bacterium]|nr:hypothetical protein [Candidatus Shapirobacteria bacterium]